MKKSILSLSLAILGLGTITTSCEDMLTPDMERYATEFNGTDSINFYLGIMRNMQGMIEQNILLGELRGDLVTPTEYVADSVSEIINFSNLKDGESAILNRSAYYKVINQCNFYLAKVDSMAMKNNNYFMRRELSQVELLRAWTYMQLVQNYGSVPFITKPVDNAGTGWETNPPEGWANPSNLLDLLNNVEGQSLTQAYNYAEVYGYPAYGSFSNGNTTISHSQMLFNADLVMGDLYLLRGETKHDYEQAAYHYHKYLTDDNDNYVQSIATVVKFERGVEVTYQTYTRWGDNIFGSNISSSDYITIIPSAANSFFGRVMTSIPQVYGFDPSSGASTTTGTTTDDSGNETEETATSGQISVKANYKNRQVEPSAGFVAMNAAQPLVYNDMNNDRTQLTGINYLTDGYYDLRLNDGAPLVRTENGRLRFIDKFCYTTGLSNDVTSTSAFKFSYGIPVYRLRQVYLKYAEAINRAGFPRFAYAILRDGLEPEKIPSDINSSTNQWLTEIVKTDTIYEHKADPADPEDYDLLESVAVTYDYTMAAPSYYYDGVAGGATCIDFNELTRSHDYQWLDFSDFTDKPNVGIRQAGRGMFAQSDSICNYETEVANRIAQERERSGRTLSEDCELIMTVDAEVAEPVKKSIDHTGKKDYYEETATYNGYNIYGPSEAEISAVETLIADEMALETAFEGSRYYDLMRIARHRDLAGEDGTAWMAWLISRRDLNLAPYESPSTVGSLFNYLNNANNWYLPAPENK